MNFCYNLFLNNVSNKYWLISDGCTNYIIHDEKLSKNFYVMRNYQIIEIIIEMKRIKLKMTNT